MMKRKNLVWLVDSGTMLGDQHFHHFRVSSSGREHQDRDTRLKASDVAMSKHMQSSLHTR
jgi:hypothetical protein